MRRCSGDAERLQPPAIRAPGRASKESVKVLIGRPLCWLTAFAAGRVEEHASIPMRGFLKGPDLAPGDSCADIVAKSCGLPTTVLSRSYPAMPPEI